MALSEEDLDDVLTLIKKSNGMTRNRTVLGFVGAFLHALFVVVGIYVAINGRLTALEVKMDVLWTQVQKAIEGRP